jgi:hypothetical protein
LSYDQINGIIKVSWTTSAQIGSVYAAYYQIKLWNITQSQLIPKFQFETPHVTKDTVPAMPITIPLYDGPNPSFVPVAGNNYALKVTAVGSDTDLNSVPGQSAAFTIPWGIGYMRVGQNFKLN